MQSGGKSLYMAHGCIKIRHTEYVHQIYIKDKITFQPPIVWGLLRLAPIISLLTFFQISGFRYICSLGGTINLPTAYNNESSLNCVVNQNQVIYSRYNKNLTTIVIYLSVFWFSAHLHRFRPVASLAGRTLPSVLCGKLCPQSLLLSNILLIFLLQSAVSTSLLVYCS